MQRISSVLISLGVSASLLSCGHGGPPSSNFAGQAVPVNLVKAEKRQLVYYDMYPAQVVALKEVELRCEVGGNVTAMNFQEGRQVRKGQVLYEIDRSRYEATFNQAKASLDIAESNLEKAQHDAERYIKLNKEDAIAKQRLDYALTDLQNAKSQVASAKADMAKAETDLKYSVIVAPFDGTIGISQVRLGALVVPDQTLLNIVSSDDPTGVDFVINEKELNRFQLLEERKPAPEDSTFRVLLPDNTLYPGTGKISIIDRAVDPTTGTIKVRLSFPNRERILRAGMNCNVKVLNENSGLQLVIPYKAVVEQMSEFFAFKVENGKAKQIKIELGTRVGPDVTVRQGLNAGDEIVVEGVQRLHDGALVALAPPVQGQPSRQ
jgi:membrane fusion protein, multidrug efflux system